MKDDKDRLFSLRTMSEVDYNEINIFVMYGWAKSGSLTEGTTMDSTITITNQNGIETTLYHVGL